MAKRGRPKNPNSQRSLLEKKKEAEQLALDGKRLFTPKEVGMIFELLGEP